MPTRRRNVQRVSWRSVTPAEYRIPHLRRHRLFSAPILFEPSRNRSEDVRVLAEAERTPRVDPMPLRQTRATACRRCVLRDEHRVAAEWCLAAVVARRCRCETLRHEVTRMIE